jgi:hypothetical protein
LTLFQNLGVGQKDMSDKQIAYFAMFGSNYGPGIPQYLIWFQNPGWESPVLNIVQKIMNPTFSGA